LELALRFLSNQKNCVRIGDAVGGTKIGVVLELRRYWHNAAAHGWHGDAGTDIATSKAHMTGIFKIQYPHCRRLRGHDRRGTWWTCQCRTLAAFRCWWIATIQVRKGVDKRLLTCSTPYFLRMWQRWWEFCLDEKKKICMRKFFPTQLGMLSGWKTHG